MTGSTQRHEIVRPVGPEAGLRNDVVTMEFVVAEGPIGSPTVPGGVVVAFVDLPPAVAPVFGVGHASG